MSKVTLDASAIDRIVEVLQKSDNQGKFLRVAVESGGCNGFQYLFDLDSDQKEGDLVLAKDQDQVIAVTDEVSANYLNGSKIEFVKELGASYFKVSNPNSTSNCGCGSSFSI